MKTATLLCSQDYLKNMTDMMPPGQGLGVSQSWAPDGKNPSFCSWKKPAKRGTPWGPFRMASMPLGPKVFDHQFSIIYVFILYNLSINHAIRICKFQSIPISFLHFDRSFGSSTGLVAMLSRSGRWRVYLVQPLARAQGSVSKRPGVETCLSKSWRRVKAWIGWLKFWGDKRFVCQHGLCKKSWYILYMYIVALKCRCPSRHYAKNLLASTLFPVRSGLCKRRCCVKPVLCENVWCNGKKVLSNCAVL